MAFMLLFSSLQNLISNPKYMNRLIKWGTVGFEPSINISNSATTFSNSSIAV
ncbi:MAG: hypothetical protein QOK72_11790 [Nitrososphaeraceae archaeon]|nr:hypothetical protein [Nitrososphaeraceae archaeon]